MSIQSSNHFIASLILELVDLEVAGIVIYGAEVISVFTVENIASDCFPWTVWNFVRGKWFLLLIFLVSSAHATLSNVCLLYTSPSPRDQRGSRMPSSA